MTTTPLCTEWCASAHESQPIANDGYFQCETTVYSDDVVEVTVWHAVDAAGPISEAARVSVAQRDHRSFDALDLTATQAVAIGAALAVASVKAFGVVPIDVLCWGVGRDVLAPQGLDHLHLEARRRVAINLDQPSGLGLVVLVAGAEALAPGLLAERPVADARRLGLALIAAADLYERSGR